MKRSTAIPQDVRTWPVLEPLAPHVRIVATSADALKIAKPTARLMHQLASLLKAQFQFCRGRAD